VQAAGRIHPSNICADGPGFVNRGAGDEVARRCVTLDRCVSKRQPVGNKPAGGRRHMSKPAKTEAELISMARAELKVHADCPDGIAISVIRDGDSWEFRAQADDATIAKPGFPECVALLVQIGDHLCKQYDFKG
jgi:hypothetical protein